MDDLVSRKAILKLLDENYVVFRAELEKLPSVDAMPVANGKWIEEPDRTNHWHCSVCNRVQGLVHKFMLYCPFCGAKMEPTELNGGLQNGNRY